MTRLLVLLHVVAGSVAVGGMLTALLTEKGSHWHRHGGQVYVWAMTFTLLLALIVSLLTANVFLFLIAIFSGYFVYTGWRLAIARDGVRSAADRYASLLMLTVSVLMVAYGIFMLLQRESMGVTLLLFGGLAAIPAWQDYKLANMWPRGRKRIVLHLGRMGGASIATTTAVFVVNVQTSPEFIAWLLPSIVITPLIVYWSRRTRGAARA